MTGGANATLTWGDGDREQGDTGKSLGTDKDVAFTGSGELDNGTTFSVMTATTDKQSALTSANMTIGTPSFGSFLLGNNSGAAHYKYDEEVPTAYEQLSDIDLTLSQNKIGDFMDNNHITYTTPTFEIGGASITADIGYASNANDTSTSDGGVARTAGATYGTGKEAGITITYDALKLGVYGAERENTTLSLIHI